MERTHHLDDRAELILQAVVHTYITSAEPVGSRLIVKRYGLDLSPATVRNVMSDLEEAGFLEQLHTSSGRVPTTLGYRYYIDYLMRVQELTLGEREQIENELSNRLNDSDEILRQTSQLLALVTHQAGIVEAPDKGSAQVRHIELVPMESNRVVVLIQDSYGRVGSMVVQSAAADAVNRAQSLSRFLNDNVRGVAVRDVRSVLRQKMAEFLDDRQRMAKEALSILDLLPPEEQGHVYCEGATLLFEQPEFRDIGRAREVMGLLEEQGRLAGLLRARLSEQRPTRTAVLLGSEVNAGGLQEISVVASPYYVGDKPVGVLGVLGPRRMQYSKLTAVVEYTAGMLGRFLTRIAS
jgi:heat-inducible transcriptional repressor